MYSIRRQIGFPFATTFRSNSSVTPSECLRSPQRRVLVPAQYSVDRRVKLISRIVFVCELLISTKIPLHKYPQSPCLNSRYIVQNKYNLSYTFNESVHLSSSILPRDCIIRQSIAFLTPFCRCWSSSYQKSCTIDVRVRTLRSRRWCFDALHPRYLCLVSVCVCVCVSVSASAIADKSALLRNIFSNNCTASQ